MWIRSRKKSNGGGGGGGDHSIVFTDSSYALATVRVSYGGSAQIQPVSGDIEVSNYNTSNTCYSLYRITLPTGLNTIKIHFNSLILKSYGGFMIIPTDISKEGVITDDALLNATRAYIRTGQTGNVSETDYELTVDISSFLPKTYLYFGLTTGCDENTTSGYENRFNGEGTCDIAWVDLY